MQNTRSSTALALSGAAPASLPTPGTKDRLVSLEAAAPGTRHAAEELIALAVAGLPQSYVGGTFAQTVRAVETPTGRIVRPEGRNLRYAAIVALGAARVDEGAQRAICAGRTAAAFAESLVPQAESSDDVGSVALVAWAVAEVAEAASESLFERLRNVFASGAPISTVECSWLITAALAARHLSDTDDLAQAAAARLMAAQGPGGLFPHMLPAHAMGRLRAHVGCFADQVYPIQALARFSVAMGEPAALAAADACAGRICHLQGSAGQWWWHYDSRNGDVVEGYPVYSVHQHAMAPMALLDLKEAGGGDYREAIAKGLRWLEARPESDGVLVSHADRLVWRKIGRSEPRKAVRSIAAVTTALRPGLHMPGLDALFAPGPIDHECRPYELGWLIYAWLSGGVVERLRDGGGAAAPAESVASRPAVTGERPLIFGLNLDALTMQDALTRCRDALSTRNPLLVGVVNAAKVVKLRKDAALRDSLLDCDLLLADGQSVVWASRLLGRPLPERVAGIDLFDELLHLAHREDRSIYLLGAKPEVLRKLTLNLARRFPGLRIAGSRDGYFRDEDGAAIAADIRESGADMLFLGMSSPKKENFLAAHRHVLDVPVMHGVGGSFDVLAGITRRAPIAWQRNGLEWAFRLLQEPRRMWRRYLTTNVEFMALAILERFRPSPALSAMPGATGVSRYETHSSPHLSHEAVR